MEPQENRVFVSRSYEIEINNYQDLIYYDPVSSDNESDHNEEVIVVYSNPNFDQGT